MEKINIIGQLNEFKPTIKVIELEQSRKYKVTKIRRVQTKFGCSIVAELDGEKQMFLPKRYNKLEDAELKHIIEAGLHIKLLEVREIGGNQCGVIEFVE